MRYRFATAAAAVATAVSVFAAQRAIGSTQVITGLVVAASIVSVVVGLAEYGPFIANRLKPFKSRWVFLAYEPSYAGAVDALLERDPERGAGLVLSPSAVGRHVAAPDRLAGGSVSRSAPRRAWDMTLENVTARFPGSREANRKVLRRGIDTDFLRAARMAVFLTDRLDDELTNAEMELARQHHIRVVVMSLHAQNLDGPDRTRFDELVRLTVESPTGVADELVAVLDRR